MSERALRMLERFEQRRPDAFRLAVLASLAVRVDAHLLRRLRTTLAPDVDVGAEADLWFSPLVESRGVHGFVLAADVNRVLRGLLAADAPLLERAHGVTTAAHARAPATIRIEEEVNALALRAGDDVLPRIDETLRPAVLAMVRDEIGGLDIARWAARALPRFHPRVHETESAALLAIGAAARLGARIERPEVSPAVTPAADYRWVLPSSAREQRTSVGVELLDDGVRFVEEGKGNALPLPRTMPLLVHILWRDGEVERQRTVEARPGRVERLGTTIDAVRFRTIAGDEFSLTAKPVRTGVDAALVQLERLGSTGPTAAGFIVAPDRIITAAEPFRGVPFLAVKHGSRSFQARVIHPSEGLEILRPEVEGSARVAELMVLEPIDEPPLAPVLPLEWRLSRQDARERNTLLVDTRAEIRWIEGDGEVFGLDGDMGVQHDGPASFTLTTEPTRPPAPPPPAGAPVIVRGRAVGVVSRVERGSLMGQRIQPSAGGWSRASGEGYRVQAVGASIIEKALGAIANARPNFRVSVAPVIDLRRERLEPLMPAVLGYRRDRWNLIELRNREHAPGLMADIHVHSIREEPAWPRALDLEEAGAVIVVIDPREDPDAAEVKRTLRRLGAGAGPDRIPALVLAPDAELHDFGKRIGRDAADFIALNPRDPHAVVALEGALARLIRWRDQPGGSRDEFERLRALLRTVEGRKFPPVMPLPDFVREAGDVRTAHAARMAGGRVLEGVGDGGVAVLDERLFETVVLAILDTSGAHGFNRPLPTIPLEEMRLRVHAILDEFHVSQDLYYATFEGVVRELERVGALAVGPGIDGSFLVYADRFEPGGPTGQAPLQADPALIARAATPVIRELLLVALELHASEQYDIRSSYWRTPPRSGLEITDRRDGAPLYLESEPDDEYRIVLRVAYGTDAENKRSLAEWVERLLRGMRADWITIERPDSGDADAPPTEE